jgi:CRISPR/Cas system CMR-associated protein Cmr5 small subunit
LEAAPELVESHNFFSTTISALLRASKRSKIEAEKARSIAEEKLASVEAHASTMETDLAKAQAEIQARDRLIASLLSDISLTQYALTI